MIRRLSWFVAGAAAGAAGVEYARLKAKRLTARYRPAAVVQGVVKDRGRDVVDALREGRVAMREKEAELRARRDGAEARPSDARVIVLETAAFRAPVAGPRRRSRR